MSKEARKRYLAKPENRMKVREYMRSYLRKYRKRSHVQEKLYAYRRRADVKERARLGARIRRLTPEGKIQNRKYDLRSRYGLTLDAVNDLIKKQAGKCILCMEPLNNELFDLKPCIDHDHKTKRIRGLVHRQCNTLLGYFERLSSVGQKNVLRNLPRHIKGK